MPNIPKTFTSRATKPAQRQGGSPTLRDHSRAYRALRASVLADSPLCRTCKRDGRITAARIVDHRLALFAGGSNERENLQALCKKCHDAKSACEARFIARGFDVQDILLDPDLRPWIE